MLGDQELVAFVGVSDLARAHRFYGGVLGLHRVDSSEYANVYTAGGTQLRVTRVPKPAAPPYTVLGWRVDDIAAAVRGADHRRRAAQPLSGHGPGRARRVEGAGRIAGGLVLRPDGNTLSLQQPPA